MTVRSSVCQGAEQGFGLIEVLVALLLLSIVALGFLSVQARLLITTTDAKLHTQAVQLMSDDYHATRSFTPSQKHSYIQTLTQISQTASSGIQAYHQGAHAAIIDCHRRCTPEQMAQSLAIRSAQSAAKSQMILSVTPCPTGRCWVAAWGNQAHTLIKSCPHTTVQAVDDRLANCIMMGGL